MSRSATETPEVAAETAPTSRVRRAERSLLIAQLRANPFRVLRLGPEVGVDRAIWTAEEALTRHRAGLALDEPDLLPWLPEPDEPEIRQAIQRIEEPLRRLADELAWFDPDADPDGDLLRRALATLDPALLNEYLARCEDDGLPRRATAEQVRDRIFADMAVFVTATNGDVAPDGADAVEATSPPATVEVPRLLNHANLRLLLAALSLHDALPRGVAVPVGVALAESDPPPIPWSSAHGLRAWEDPHEVDLTGGRQAARDRATTALWRVALDRWLRLAAAPTFLASVQARIARLGDEVVGEDDAEAIVNAATSRVMDLLVGEVKAQLLAGRLDRVRALLAAAGSGEFDPRRWASAFRQLRPLFRTAAAELDPLLPQEDDARIEDAALYLSRLRGLLARWKAIDPKGLLGLGEVGDECVTRACASLSNLETFPNADRLRALYAEASSLASADSLKQRIAASVGRVDGLEGYACHFCRTREMDPNRSIMITGKKESHRTHGFNSTTIHYTVNAALIPRCPRCSDLHAYLWQNSGTLRAAIGVATAAAVGYLFWMRVFGPQTEAIAYIFLAGIAALVIYAMGIPIRWISAWLTTPRGERPYWKSRTAKPYRDMVAQGCTMTVDYRRDALKQFNEQRQRQG